MKYFVYCHDIHLSQNQELEKTYEEKNILGVFQFWNYVTVDGKTYQTVACKHLKMWWIAFVLQFGLKVNK